MSAYARPAMHPTQDGRGYSRSEGGSPSSSPGARDLLDASPAAPAGAGVLHPATESESSSLQRAVEVADRVRGGQLRWVGIVLAGMIASFLMGQPELGISVVIAAIFAAGQAWDVLDRTRAYHGAADSLLAPGEGSVWLRWLLPALPACLGASGYFGVAWWAARAPNSPEHTFAFQWSIAAAFVMVLLVFPPVAQAWASLLVRPPARTYTARLTSTMALMVMLLPVPMRLLSEQWIRAIESSAKAVLTASGLLGQLAGEVALALGAVGLWVSRTPRATWVRLGLGPMGRREWAVAGVGVAVMLLLNFTLEWCQRTWFPELWRQDQAMVELIVSDMSLATLLVLGVSAGVGEELLLRGALQPRTGLVWASVIFALAHVQYTWFGIGVVALFGIALGLVRQRTNTTTAIVVHALYDILAALGQS